MPADPLLLFPLDPSLRPALALGILGLTYLIIALQKVPFTRLDRPSGALLGAVLTVTLGVLTPQQVYREAIHFDTIALLLGMMILAAYLAEAAFFRKASQLALRAARTPRGLLAGVTLVCAGLSAFLVNDTVCVMVTPLVLQLVDDAKLPPLPYLLGVAMGSNVGSAATFTGNPQNMLVGQLSGISYGHFAAVMAPIALVTSLMCAGLLVLLFRKQLPRRRFELQPPPPPVDRPLLAKSMIAFFGVVIAFFAGLPTAWSALAAAALLMAVGNRSPRRVFERVDFVLLLFFAGLFVVVYGVDATGWTERMLSALRPHLGSSASGQVVALSAVSVVASNLFSNVPFVMLAGKWIPAFAEPTLMWFALALSSTLAGNLTLVGSVANLIVAESAGERCRLGFLDYLAAGVPVTLVTTAAGVGLLLGLAALGLV